MVGHEITSSNLLLRHVSFPIPPRSCNVEDELITQFLFLLISSMFLDLWNLLFHLSGIPLLLAFFLFAIKVPITLSTMENLRQRGDTIQLPGYGGFPSMAGYNQAEQGQGQGQAGKSLATFIECHQSIL